MSTSTATVRTPPGKLGPARFAAGDDTHVIRRGLIFRSGEYKDKDFAMTPAELRRAVALHAGPVPIDLEHTSTVLDGKLGEADALELSADGTELFATVRLAKWLDDALGDAKRRVSCTWDRATKTLKGLALVNHPRVADAALMAAFAGAQPQTYHGLSIIQRMHDTAAEAGALCSEASKGSAAFVSAGERSAIQRIHDSAVEAGAKCQFVNTRSGPAMAMYSGASGLTESKGEATMSKTAREQLKQYLDGLAEGADIDPHAVAPIIGLEIEADETYEETAVAARDAIREAALAADLPADFSKDPAFVAIQQRLNATEVALKAARAEAVKSAAAQWAEAEVASGRSSAAEFALRVEEYLDAAADDDATPRTVTFSAEGKKATGSRVDALKARHAARPARHFGERIPAHTITLSNGGGKAKDEDEEARQVNDRYYQRQGIKPVAAN